MHSKSFLNHPFARLQLLDSDVLCKYFYIQYKIKKMENTSVLERISISNRFHEVQLDQTLKQNENSAINLILENILSEGCNDFFHYLEFTGILKESNIMVLSSMHHYYYDHNDLKGIKTLINLKKLNQVKHLESFLHTLFRIMPSNAYFVGCFKNTNHNGNGISLYQSSKFFNGLINLIDPKTDAGLSKKSVIKLLEEHGFKIIDITDIDRTTYFWAQVLRRPCE